MSAEEKWQGAKTCDAIIRAAKQLPSSRHNSLLNGLHPKLTRLRDGVAAGGDEKEKAKPKALKPKGMPPAKAVDSDEEVRRALALLEDVLVDAKANKDVAGPCVVDFAADMKEAVDVFIEPRPILKATLAEQGGP